MQTASRFAGCTIGSNKKIGPNGRLASLTVQYDASGIFLDRVYGVAINKANISVADFQSVVNECHIESGAIDKYQPFLWEFLNYRFLVIIGVGETINPIFCVVEY